VCVLLDPTRHIGIERAEPRAHGVRVPAVDALERRAAGRRAHAIGRAGAATTRAAPTRSPRTDSSPGSVGGTPPKRCTMRIASRSFASRTPDRSALASEARTRGRGSDTAATNDARSARAEGESESRRFTGGVAEAYRPL